MWQRHVPEHFKWPSLTIHSLVSLQLCHPVGLRDPKALSLGPTSPWLQQRASQPLGPHACPGYPMEKNQGLLISRMSKNCHVPKIFWTYSLQSLRLGSVTPPVRSSNILVLQKQYQVITTDLEDVGIVTVGVLATKLIDLAPSRSHRNGMFRTINGAVSVCLEEWSPVNVVHDFLNGMILHIHSRGGIRQWIGIHNNIWTKKSAKHTVDTLVYLSIPEKYRWTALTSWTVLDEKISHELPRGGCVCNFGRWDCRKETCESCNMIHPWRIPWKSLDISHDPVEWLTCCASFVQLQRSEQRLHGSW